MSTSITCPRCERTSYNTGDIKNKYCGNCHEYHEQMGESYPSAHKDAPKGMTVLVPEITPEGDLLIRLDRGFPLEVRIGFSELLRDLFMRWWWT